MNTGGCTLLSGPWWYDGTQYQQVASGTAMEDFKGYWVKVGGGCSVSSQEVHDRGRGEAFASGFNQIPRLPTANASPLQSQPPAPPGGLSPTLKLHVGWNMISSPIRSVPLSAVQGDCLFSSGPWWWTGTRYEQASTLESAKGYWVKVGVSCTLQTPPSSGSFPQSLALNPGWNLISSSGSWNQLNTGGCTLLSGPWWWNGKQYKQIAPGTPLNGFKGYWAKVAQGCNVNSQGLSGRGAAPASTSSSIAQQAVPLRLEGVRLSWVGSGLELQVQGEGIARSELRLYDLAGTLVAQARGRGNRLHLATGCLSGPWWWNGKQYKQITPGTPLNGFKGYWAKVSQGCNVNSQGLSGRGAAPASTSSSIAQQAVPLRLEGVRLSWVGSGLELQVQGEGIARSELRLYDLAGTLVAQARGRGNRLHLATLGQQGRPLANGVYLYIVTVKGADGQATSSEVRKLLLLR